jgi:hypothetical protein
VRIVVISDIHNDVENLLKLLDPLTKLEFDVIVCPGDITDAALPHGFEHVDIARLFLEELKILGKPILVVPGNQDGEILGFLEETGLSLHGKGKVVQGIGFYGFGGAKTPFKTSLEPEEGEIEANLRKAYEEVKDAEVKVQVTHAPPARTRLDILPSGAHVGSEKVRQFIETHVPTVAISAHIHEARGTDELGRTRLINSGRFPEGYCGFIDVEKDRVDLKVINLT